jgi:hypothetical protein
MNASIDFLRVEVLERVAEVSPKTRSERTPNSPRTWKPVLVALMLGVVRLSAATWVAGGTGQWMDAGKWAGGPPAEDSDVEIRGLGNVTVGGDTPDSMLRVQKLDLLPEGGSSPVLMINNLGARQFSASDTITLDGNAVLEVHGSTLRIDGVQGGHFNFLGGEVSLQEGRIQATRGATFRVGRMGRGLMTVLSGELIAEADLIVGGLGGSSGVMVLQSGLVRASGMFQVADDIGSEGVVRIHGGQLVATNMTARIGDDGHGSLEVHGGAVRFGDVSVGRDRTGQGQLRVSGGRLEAGDISLGRLVGSQGVASFSGGEALLPMDHLYVGREGHGVLRLEGGTVHASNVVVAAGQGASGVMEIHSGVLRTGRLNVASANATFRWEGGRIETASTAADSRPFIVGNGRSPAVLLLLGGEHVFPGGLVISSNAVLEGQGTVVGRLTVLAGGSNRLERGGTLPAAPVLALSLTDGVPHVSLESVAGLVYVVEARSSGIIGWSIVGRVVGTGGLVTVVDSSGRQPFRIYRARVE